MKLVEKVIDYFENNKAPLGNFIASFLFFVLLRNFIEAYATHQDYFLIQTLTYSPFYIALVCWFILLFHIFTKQNIVKVSKIVLAFNIIILLPPVLDLFFSPGPAVRMQYATYSGFKKFLITYFSMGTMGGIRNSLGQRIEIIIAVVGSFFYFFSKTNRFVLSGIYAIVIYTSISIFGISLSLLNSFFRWLHIEYIQSQDYFFLARLYFIITIICIILLFYLHNKERFKLIVKDIRPLRIVKYLVMVGIGMVLLRYRTPEEISIPFEVNTETFFFFFLIPISGIFAAVFTIVSNNIEDIEIDRISNPNRPLARNQFSEKEYKTIGYISLAIALLASMLVNRSCFIFMGLIIGNYFLYSNPPFKLKRIPVLAKLLIGMNCAFMALMGYTVFGGAVLSFPSGVLFFLVIGIGLSANFIDLKDYEGDKLSGIKTLPVLLGLRWAKIAISIFTVFTFAIFYFVIKPYIIHLWLLMPVPLLLTAHLFFLNKKNYKETPVFIVYLFEIIGIIFIMILDSRL